MWRDLGAVLLIFCSDAKGRGEERVGVGWGCACGDGESTLSHAPYSGGLAALTLGGKTKAR